MTDAHIERYCAIEDTFCSRTVEYQGAWSYFMAYPSSPYWSDFASYLDAELKSRGGVGRRWEDHAKGSLLFDKICEGIHAHDILFAEVSEPNANVLFEVGYALAVGRLPILLIDTNRPRWRRELLTTLESAFYTSREDIHTYLAKLLESREVPETPDEPLPLLDLMGITDIVEQRATVYHLRPKINTDAIRQVDRVLQRSYFKLATMDPSDTAYDDFFEQARKIREAQLIVASLVSNSNDGHEEHNSNVALLAGFAIGLGKRVLVLQQMPLAPILDLGTVGRPFETESQAKEILEHWVGERTQANVAQVQEIAKAEGVREQAEQIRGLYLGPSDALQDYNLLEYFVPTKEYEEAIQGTRALFLGRRGSGKSATFEAVCDKVQKEKNTILVKIAPEDFELQTVTGFFRSEYALANRDLVYQTVWQYVFLTEIANALQRNTDLLYSSPEDSLRTRLYDYVIEHAEGLELDFGTRLVQQLKAVDTLASGGTDSDLKRRMETTVAALRDYDLGRALRDFAKQEGLTYHIAIDDLDKHWKPSDSHSVSLLLGLVAEGDHLRRFFGASLKIVTFLREDMFDILTRYDEDFQKRDYTRMEWSSASLKHVVAERLAWGSKAGNIDDERTWKAVFPEAISSMEASDYILARALPRPRDVLKFCQFAIDEAQRNGHSSVLAQDIKDGERKFSEDEFRTVTTEFQTSYPQLGEALIELASAPSQDALVSIQVLRRRNHCEIFHAYEGLARCGLHRC